MNELFKILDKRLREEEKFEILEEAIHAKFDADLRHDLEKDLKKNYKLSRKNKVVGLSSLKTRILFVSGIAAGILILLFALDVFSPATPSAQSLASSYLEEVEMYHHQSLKGSTNNEDFRTKAARAFNRKNFAEAAYQFSLIEKPTEEDLYYGAMASLFDQKIADSISKFALISDQTSSYKEEIRWYHSIALLLNHEEEKAKSSLLKIQPSEWNFDKAQALLKAMD